jgi:hypothetical protein
LDVAQPARSETTNSNETLFGERMLPEVELDLPKTGTLTSRDLDLLGGRDQLDEIGI